MIAKLSTPFLGVKAFVIMECGTRRRIYVALGGMDRAGGRAAGAISRRQLLDVGLSMKQMTKRLTWSRWPTG
jgi:hypothetical protein